jgi:hypothetical protein
MLPEFRGDRLSFLVRTARTYGGVARFVIRGRSVFLVTDPAASSACFRTTPITTGGRRAAWTR